MKNKEVVIEYTESDVAEMRSQGIDEDAIPNVGKHVFRRGGFSERFPNFNRKESKARINIYIDLDVIDHFRQRAEKPNAAPYQTQINAELRSIMQRDLDLEKTEMDATGKKLLADDIFLEALSKKLRKKELQPS